MSSLVSLGAGNGEFPFGGLTEGPDGNLYGTAESGGVGTSAGTIFQVTTNGVLTALHQFQTSGGYSPLARMILGADGSFYGTTGSGTVFRFSLITGLTTLAVFHGTNGAQPQGPLVFGADGNLYGTTVFGGSGRGGTVFRIPLAAKLSGIRSGPDGFVRLLGTGPPGASFSLRSSTDLSAPMSAWAVLASGVFEANGEFAYTNSTAGDATTRFYRLSTP